MSTYQAMTKTERNAFFDNLDDSTNAVFADLDELKKSLTTEQQQKLLDKIATFVYKEIDFQYELFVNNKDRKE